MNKTIETSKGRFVVIEDKNKTHYPFHLYIQLHGNRCYKLSEITEEEASTIMDSDNRFTHIDYLHNALIEQGIEITNNTYIFKV